VILSTGEVIDLPRANTRDRGETTPIPVTLGSEKMNSGSGNAVYRRHHRLDIRSLTPTDSNSRVGGKTSYASSFNIDALTIRHTRFDSVSGAADLKVLAWLDVFDFSNARLDFTRVAKGTRPSSC